MKIGLREFYSFIHDEKRLKEKKVEILEKLNKKKIGNFSFLEKEGKYDTIVNLILTGGTEGLFMEGLSEMEEPIVIFFDSKDNSLAATLELKTKLIDLKKHVIALSIDEKGDIIQQILKVAYLKRKLKGTKIGSIGIPSPWLVASIPDQDRVKEKFGIDIINIELQELYKEIENIKDEETFALKEEFTKNAKDVREPKEKTLIETIKIYIALKRIIKKYKLSGITLACFTILDVLKNTGCFALSQLNDEGLIAGCEGDIESTITMFILYHLTGKIPFMANPSAIDLRENSMILAHCTIAKKLLKNYIIRSHFESGIGVGIQGEMDAKEVTIFRIGGKNMDKHILYTGTLMPIEHSEHLCRTQIKVKLNEDLSHLLENPAGNHLIVIKGNHKDIIEKFLQVS